MADALRIRLHRFDFGLGLVTTLRVHVIGMWRLSWIYENGFTAIMIIARAKAPGRIQGRSYANTMAPTSHRKTLRWTSDRECFNRVCYVL